MNEVHVQLSAFEEYFSDKAATEERGELRVESTRKMCKAVEVVWVTGASAGFGEALCIALCQAAHGPDESYGLLDGLVQSKMLDR